MKYIEFEALVSPQRLGRYNKACNDHILKTLTLYRANIRISQAFLGTLSFFEVILHDKLVTELNFGFWKHMFAGRQFQAAGSTLLAIFPKLPARCNQGFIYQKLHKINSIRNRIAHHEPICFGTGNNISAVYARRHFQEMREIFDYMGVDSHHLLNGFTNVLEEANYIDSFL